MLFSPPLPPVLIPRTRDLIIGRSSACDLPIPSRAASRRHAAVRFSETGQLVIEDLDSKNGTCVNGQPIFGPQPLLPGDVIEIGSVVVTYCRVDDRFTSLNDCDDTQGLEIKRLQAEEEALGGELEYIPIHAVFQMLENQGQSGVLRVDSEHGPCRLWVVDGRPAHAETPGATGLDAAQQILNLRHGPFTFEQNRPPPARTLVLSMTELLLDTSRKRDEDRLGPAGAMSNAS